MPNSSGGAVVASSNRLIGVHVTSCWHRASLGSGSESGGGSSAGGWSRGGSNSNSTEPPDMLETDSSKLWEDSSGEEADFSDHEAAQESLLNIPVSPSLLHACVCMWGEGGREGGPGREGQGGRAREGFLFQHASHMLDLF